MEQGIKADAIEKEGFIALRIHFKTGKADILPESRPLIAEIVASAGSGRPDRGRKGAEPAGGDREEAPPAQPEKRS